MTQVDPKTTHDICNQSDLSSTQSRQLKKPRHLLARRIGPIFLMSPQVLTRYILCMCFCVEQMIMSKEAVFTMKLEPELRAEFMAEAEASHRPASQVLRELMREFVQRQREARAYDEFLRGKVEAGRVSMRTGQGRSNDDVEAEFATRRSRVAAQA
jgi:predicted transcriptional regulator